jgi:hypothetical protein
MNGKHGASPGLFPHKPVSRRGDKERANRRYCADQRLFWTCGQRRSNAFDQFSKTNCLGQKVGLTPKAPPGS